MEMRLLCVVCVCVYIYTYTHTHTKFRQFMAPLGPYKLEMLVFIRGNSGFELKKIISVVQQFFGFRISDYSGKSICIHVVLHD